MALINLLNFVRLLYSSVVSRFLWRKIVFITLFFFSIRWEGKEFLLRVTQRQIWFPNVSLVFVDYIHPWTNLNSVINAGSLDGAKEDSKIYFVSETDQAPVNPEENLPYCSTDLFSFSLERTINLKWVA